jgi:hypothetical protein
MKRNFFAFMALVVLLAACATAKPETSAADELDRVIREASDYINKNVPTGNKLVILNIKSDYPPLSEYIIDVLTGNVVNDRIFTVVDRANLTLIQQEMDFQLSGEVSDESAQSIGQKLGAQTIISGSITPFGNLWRLTVRALGVEGATVQGMFNRNIPNGDSVAALTSGGSVVGVSASAVGARTQAAAPAEPPVPVVYNIGDKGPAGGFIFHDKGVFTNGWRYLEAAPNDIGPSQWGPRANVNGTSTAVGTGKVNTQRIAAWLEQSREDGAALLCTAVNISGYTDWFLPSQDELDLVYKNLKQKGLGGFGNGWYWSSSQGSSGSLKGALMQNFGDGRQTSGRLNKTDSCSVRAVRAF